MSGLPPLDSVTRQTVASGENDGAELMPLVLDTTWREPVPRSCT